MSRSSYVARSGTALRPRGPRRPLLLATFAVALATSACKRAPPDPEASIRASFVEKQALAGDAGAAWRLTSTDEVYFDDGWNAMETGKAGVHGEVWRWMGRTALIRLRTHNAPRKLELTGWVPMHLLNAPPMMTLRWRGNRVDAFLAPEGHFTKTIDITEAMQAGTTYADFTIETSSTGSERDDSRELGYALAEIRWESPKD